jgi:hypothetical protein
VRKILTHSGEPLEPPHLSTGRGPSVDWCEMARSDGDAELEQPSPDDLRRMTFVTANSRWPPFATARSRSRIEGDSEAIYADGEILGVNLILLSFFCRLRGGSVRELPSKGSRGQRIGCSWGMLRPRKRR